MNKGLITLFTGLLLTVSGYSYGLNLKIGYVDMMRMYEDSPQAKVASARLKAEFEPRQQKIIDTDKALRKDEERMLRDSGIMSTADVQKKEQMLLSKRRELKLQETEFKEDFAIRRNEERKNVQKLVNKAVEELAKQEGYDLILFEGVAFASPQTDITDKLIKAMTK